MSTHATTPAAHTAARTARIISLAGTVALWAGGAALVLAPFFLAFRSGGYGLPAGDPGNQGQLIVAGTALALLALIALTVPWPALPRGLPLAALAALGGLALWTGLSTQWTRLVDHAVLDTSRLTMYTAVFALALVALRVAPLRRALPWLFLAGVSVVAIYALAGRFLPHLVHEKTGCARLCQPLTYWNALGIFTGFGLVLAVALAGGDRGPLRLRALACAAGVPCGLASYMTLSRGAAAGVVAGLVVCVALRADRRALLAALCALVPLVALALLLNAFPDVQTVGADASAQASQGARFLPLAVVGTLAAGIAYAFGARSRRGDRALPLSPRALRLLAAGAVPVVLAAGIAVSAHGTEKTSVPVGTSRFAVTQTDRGHYWRVSLAAFRRHPIAGIGSASFEAEWTRHRGSDPPARDAHSLYIETLAELGLVGALLLLALYAAVTAGLVRALRARAHDPLLVAAAGVLAAFAVHAGLDWDWEMPAVSLIPLILAAAALQPRMDP